MGAFRRFAFAAAARDAGFVALAAATLMLAFSFAPALSLSIGANIALVFAVCMMLRAACLRDEASSARKPGASSSRRSALPAISAAAWRAMNSRTCSFGSRRPRPVRRSFFMGPRWPFP